MTDDLVARLRLYAEQKKQNRYAGLGLLLSDSADEIERLRAERGFLCEALREISQMKDEPYSAEFAEDMLHHARLVGEA